MPYNAKAAADVNVDSLHYLSASALSRRPALPKHYKKL